MYSEIQLEFRVDSLANDKVINMSVRYNKLLLSMLAPGLGIDINSESGDNQLLKVMADSLQGQWFSLSMRPSGELISLKGLASVFLKLSEYPVENQATGRS